MNEWKKSFISSAKLELFLNNTTNSRHLQQQDMHYGAFPQLIILNMMWTNSPRIFLWSIIQLSNGKKYYDNSLITYQKISQNISYPLSHQCVLVAPYQVNGYSMWRSVWIFYLSELKKLWRKVWETVSGWTKLQVIFSQLIILF